MKESNEISVVKDAENPIAVEVMEQAIVDIGNAMKQIRNSRLTRKALVVLIAHHSGQYMNVVRAVLDSMDQLERVYLEPKASRKR